MLKIFVSISHDGQKAIFLFKKIELLYILKFESLDEFIPHALEIKTMEKLSNALFEALPKLRFNVIHNDDCINIRIRETDKIVTIKTFEKSSTHTKILITDSDEKVISNCASENKNVLRIIISALTRQYVDAIVRKEAKPNPDARMFAKILHKAMPNNIICKISVNDCVASVTTSKRQKQDFDVITFCANDDKDEIIRADIMFVKVAGNELRGIVDHVPKVLQPVLTFYSNGCVTDVIIDIVDHFSHCYEYQKFKRMPKDSIPKDKSTSSAPDVMIDLSERFFRCYDHVSVDVRPMIDIIRKKKEDCV